MATLIYAVGDIHGSYTKLANLFRHCTTHCGANTSRFVFIGDYIDRGRRSRDVVSFLIKAQADALRRSGSIESRQANSIV